MDALKIAAEGAAAASRSDEARRLSALLKLSGLISRPMLDAVATPRGMSLNELRVLMCLGGEGPLAGHAISDLMSMQPMNVSRAIASLLERGWVEKSRDETDRRQKPVKVSRSGEAQLQALGADLDSVAASMFAGLNARDLGALERVVGKIVANIEAWPRSDAPPSRQEPGRAGSD